MPNNDNHEQKYCYHCGDQAIHTLAYCKKLHNMNDKHNEKYPSIIALYIGCVHYSL